MPRKSRSAAGKKSDVIRHHAVRVFVSDAELALLQSRAGGRPISAFLRESGLKITERKSEALLPLILQIARVGNNLNQIARILNSRHKTGSSIHLVEVAVRLRGIEKDLGNVLQDFRKGQGKDERH